ncbi:PP2C family protein-serine/threonine phosphatase [Azospirillum agricola]|uniref:PP2C family protein-serine/threonine phosphatase n=1 Tax=Azospirillum agricola TaxID=1720247 RepID=UPI0037BE9BEB
MESRVLIRRLQSYRARVEGELAIAHSMREHLLPSPALCESLGRAAGVVLHAHTAASDTLGGDLWGVLRLDGPRFGVFLLDMGGCGVSAAMDAFRMHTLLHELAPEHGCDPAGLLAALNERALGLLEPGQRASVIYGVVDGAAGSFVHAAAAAPPPLLFAPPEFAQPESGAPRSDAPLAGGTAGSAIGTAPDLRYEARSLPLAPGAVLALGSASLLQTADSGGGAVGLAALVARAAGPEGHTLLRIERSAAA